MPDVVRIGSFDASGAEFAEFLTLPRRLYAGDPAAPPWDPEEDRRRFLPSHPFFACGEERYFLAWRGGRVVARCAAILNQRLLRREPHTGLVGFFESENDPEAAVHLLEAAIRWLAARGIRRVRAPVDRDTWHRYRVLVEGFGTPPVTLEPYNPPWYAALFRAAGFRHEVPYLTTETTALRAITERHQPYVERCTRRGTRIRGLRLDHFEEELRGVYHISLEIFAENYGFSPIPWDEFLDLYRPLRPLCDPDFMVVACDAEEQPIGYCFAFLDPRMATDPEGPALNIKTLGVVPRRRAHGVGLALIGRVYAAAAARGIRRVRHCLMKSDNTSRRYDEAFMRTLKEYRLFERIL